MYWEQVAVLHGTSPVKATSAIYGVPLPYETKLDSFGAPRATEHYHDLYRYTNDVMDYLHPRHGADNPGKISSHTLLAAISAFTLVFDSAQSVLSEHIPDV